MKRRLVYWVLVVVLAAGVWGAYRVWLEAQTKVAVSGTWQLCAAIQLFRKEVGYYPAGQSDVVKLLEREKSPQSGAPYLSDRDHFFSQEGRVVEYRREGTDAFSVVLRAHPASINTRILGTTPSVRCESYVTKEKGSGEFRPACSCEIAP